MTTEQIEIAKAFVNVTFLPGSWNKRFAQTMMIKATNSPEENISEKSNEWLYRLLYTYRRQIPRTYERYKDNQFCKKLSK